MIWASVKRSLFIRISSILTLRKFSFKSHSFYGGITEADRLVQTIRQRGARLAIPGLVDLSEVLAEAEGVTRVVLEAMQEMLLRLSLQMAREDYEDRRERQKQGIEQAKTLGRYRGRKPNRKVHERIVALRQGGTSILETARLVGCSPSHVKKVWLHYTSTMVADGA